MDEAEKTGGTWTWTEGGKMTPPMPYDISMADFDRERQKLHEPDPQENERPSSASPEED